MTVSVEDLRVVFDFARLDEPGVELLGVSVPLVATRFEQVSAAVGQYDDMIPLARQVLGSDEALFAQMAEVA